MLNACAPGVAVVNIDNGFGAGYLAACINGNAAGGPAEADGAETAEPTEAHATRIP